VLKPLLDRDIIKENFILNFSKVIELFGEEMDRCKHMFDSHVEQVKQFFFIVDCTKSTLYNLSCNSRKRGIKCI